MNDNDIIKALECCGSEVTTRLNCQECPMGGKRDCMTCLYRQALDLINRLQAEIERLNGIIGKDIFIPNVRGCGKTEMVKAKIHIRMNEVKSAARKEFAERLLDECLEYPSNDGYLTILINRRDFDNLLEEMEKENGNAQG